MSENGWQLIAEHVQCKAFRSGWLGLLDHALAVLLRRPPPYVLEHMTFSVWVKTDGRPALSTVQQSPEPIADPLEGRAGPVGIATDGKPPERWHSYWVGDVLHLCCEDGTARRYKFDADTWRILPDPPATPTAP
ncbi:MAG: hypothetical protein HY323_07210 [Betaproteobacteria bacterium]|nr:hypothetical protein [Betaproteobacteria bacterium]